MDYTALLIAVLLDPLIFIPAIAAGLWLKRGRPIAGVGFLSSLAATALVEVLNGPAGLMPAIGFPVRLVAFGLIVLATRVLKHAWHTTDKQDA